MTLFVDEPFYFKQNMEMQTHEEDQIQSDLPLIPTTPSSSASTTPTLATPSEVDPSPTLKRCRPRASAAKVGIILQQLKMDSCKRRKKTPSVEKEDEKVTKDETVEDKVKKTNEEKEEEKKEEKSEEKEELTSEETRNKETSEKNEDSKSEGLGEKRNKKITPRKGLTWQVGAHLEAQDSASGSWYKAKIVQVEEEEGKVLIHFEKWSKKYDRWFECESDELRPMPCVESNKKKNNGGERSHKFKVDDEVLARWSDAKMYPARISGLCGDQYCYVLFYDGYRKKVRISNVSKMPLNYDGVRIPPPIAAPAAVATAAAVKTPEVLAVSSIVPIVPFIPPVAVKEFTVKEDHNEHKCETCGKGFRKKTLLDSHVKHYHKEVKGRAKKEEKEEKTEKETIATEEETKSVVTKEEAKTSQPNDSQLQLKQSEEGGSKRVVEKPQKLAVSKASAPKSYSQSRGGERKKMFVKLPSFTSQIASHKKEVKEIQLKEEKNEKVGQTSATPSRSASLDDSEEQTSELAIDCDYEMKSEESSSKKPKEKRKYIRKAIPSTATRKSTREPRLVQSTFPSYPPNPMTPPTPLTPAYTPSVIMEEKPVPNTKLPFWDAITMAEIHESEPEELVNCMCILKEESGLMVQCEVCNFWQHGMCVNFENEEEVPEAYVCFACKSPRLVRQNERYDYAINAFLKKGVLPNVTSATTSNPTLANINTLLAATLEAREVLVSLRHKINSAPAKKGGENQVDILDTLKSGKVGLLDWTLDNNEVDESSQSTIVDPLDCDQQIASCIERLNAHLDTIERQVTALEEECCVDESESDAIMKDQLKYMLKDLNTAYAITQCQYAK